MAGIVGMLLEMPGEERQAAIEAQPWNEEPSEPEPVAETKELPFQNVRVTVVTPAQIEVEWDTEGFFRAMVEVWYKGDKINSISVNTKKAVLAVAPGTEVTVTVSAKDHTESIECQIPDAKNYREYSFSREGTYTAFVVDGRTDFYKQTRKGIRAITRDELLTNLSKGYAYGTHVSFNWKKTQADKVFSDLIVVTRAPDGRVFVEETSPMTIPGSWPGAYAVIQVNSPLRHFLRDTDFVYGKYQFFIYTEGLLLGSSGLTINP
jgi:hypothetical protein